MRGARVAAIAALLAVGAGCSFGSRSVDEAAIIAPPVRETSSLALRQLQVRDYAVADDAAVMRAVIASLQDEGFTITGADSDLGLVSATLEAPPTRNERRTKRRYWFAASNDPRIIDRRLEATISVMPVSGGTRVRLGFVTRDASDDGIAASTVDDPEIYRNMFSRLDRAVFYEQQRL